MKDNAQSTTNIIKIIDVQSSCRKVIQELYNYESRPNEIIRAISRNAKIDEAIRLDIIEYDSFDDELSLSSDTEEYYKTRLGQNSETSIGLIGDKISKLRIQLSNYDLRVKNLESPQKEIKAIYKILNGVPSLLRFNLHAISSSSIFAFKNEPNFEIKMSKLELCQTEITELIKASTAVDALLDEQYNFFKSMQNRRINSSVLKLRHNSASIESSFGRLYEDIKNFINQSIKDGEFIKKLQTLKELKDNNALFEKTNIERLLIEKSVIASDVKEKRLHPDDRIHDYVDTITKIIDSRELELKDVKEDKALLYDKNEKIDIQKKLYNYQKLNRNFLLQEKDLVSFLIVSEIDEKRLLGVFIRLLKNYSHKYNIERNSFIAINKRRYLEVFSNQTEVK